MTPVAIITGASAGIGAELAREFARHGHRLMLVARRRDRLEALAADIAATGAPKPAILPLDLAAPGAAARIREALAAEGLTAQYVVNNAGYGLSGHAAELDRADQLGIVDINVRALTELSLAFVDDLARNRGGILNVGSVAGFVPGPGSAVYYASKAYVVSFSEALHHELRRNGVRVTVLCPGPVETEFQARAGITDSRSPRILDEPADKVAAIGYRALMRGRRVAVAGLGNRIAVLLLRIVPNAWLMHILDARQAGRRRPPSAPAA